MIVLLAFLALASAAPRYGDWSASYQSHSQLHHPPPPPHHPPPPPPPNYEGSEMTDDLFGGAIFDTRRFWQDLETEMQRFDEMMTNFYRHFPTTSSSAGVVGNEYIVTITLTGFEEKDIKVKAKEGVLMVQAVDTSEDGSERSYLDLKTLPSYVNVNGKWTYEMGTLKIVFPINKPDDVTETITVNPEENKSREEMDTDGNEKHNINHNEDADVGLNRGDNDKDNEILTNAIPNDNNVEATTYAVDLKNEVEFVPVKY